MIKVYAYEKCSTCRKALQWLEEAGVEVEVIPIRERPPTRKELRQVAEALDGNLKALFNTSGVTYRSLNLKQRLRMLTDGQKINLLAQNGNLVKRPFVVGEGVALVGFKPDQWASVFE